MTFHFIPSTTQYLYYSESVSFLLQGQWSLGLCWTSGFRFGPELSWELFIFLGVSRYLPLFTPTLFMLLSFLVCFQILFCWVPIPNPPPPCVYVCVFCFRISLFGGLSLSGPFFTACETCFTAITLGPVILLPWVVSLFSGSRIFFFLYFHP